MEKNVIYVIVEVFEDGYSYTDGFVNTVYADVSSALQAKHRLEQSMKGQPYTCKIIKRELL